MKIIFLMFLLFLFAIVVGVLYAGLKLWLFFRRRIAPAQKQYREQMAAFQQQMRQEQHDDEVVYSNNDVVVMKGEAKKNAGRDADSTINNDETKALNE